ncbi:MAG: DUF4440 domain-containing protein [Ignavibacteriaceae bacterium]|nr:DUF4440 domain-containing protein [Ignavibacteriaceae bacterium]
MKILIIVIGCLLVAAQGVFAQTTDDELITAALYKSADDWNRGDLEAYMNAYHKSDSLLFVGSKGLTYGWEQTLKNYKKSYPDTDAMGKLEFTIHKLELLSTDSAFLLGGWKLTRKKGDLSGAFTLLWKRIEGKWVIVIDHSS